MIDFTVSDLRKELDKFINSNEEYDSLEGFLEEFNYNKEEYFVFGTLPFKYVDSYGGVGEGDDYWIVFSIGSENNVRYFEVPGAYASYEGGEYYTDDMFEVKPVEVIKTEYKKLSKKETE